MHSDIVERLNGALSGRYRVRDELGEGGMAHVYLADDQRHERRVALKVLKPELAAVVGADRFLAEIKTTANLQHPHILPLFDSGQADSFLYYVMPFVEGESLRERLEREKQLPVDEALDIATKVAGALEAAHDRGVIHRDIKPANILLSAGEPSVADFGIALAISQAGGGRLTETGLSVGTPHYMSPEQATGEEHVGPATDTYALACVLYEMLVGEPPHTGATAQAILGRIIAGELAPVRAHRKSVPEHVDQAIQRALEKLPADRFPTTQGFADALRDPAFRWGGVAPARARSAAPGPWRTWALTATAAAVILAAIAVVSFGSRSTGQGVLRMPIRLVDIEEWPAGYLYRSVAFTPDGSGIVYTERDEPNGPSRLYLKARDRAGGVAIDGSEAAAFPMVSPDGAWLAFVAPEPDSRRVIRKIPMGGGAAITLADSLSSIFTAVTWADDGTIWYVDIEDRLRRIDAASGADYGFPGGAQTIPLQAVHVVPLPDDRGALVTICTTSCLETELLALDLETGESRILVAGAVTGFFLPPNDVLYVHRNGGAFIVGLDLETLELEGSHRPVLDGIRTSLSAADVTLSRDGDLLFVRGPAQAALTNRNRPAWVDRTGNAEPVDSAWFGEFHWPVVSPDGSRLAVTMGTQPATDIWIKELPDGPRIPMTSDALRNRRPGFVADGTRLAWQLEKDNDQYFVIRRADGSAPAEVLLDPDTNVHGLTFSPAGSWLFYRQGDIQSGEADVWYMDFMSDTAPRPLLEGAFNQKTPVLSPDGRWLAFASNESGSDEVYVRPFPDVLSARVQVSVSGGNEPRWSPAGDEIFFIDLDGVLTAAAYSANGTFRITGREALFDVTGRFRRSGDTHGYDVSPDGRRFLMTTELEIAELDLIEGRPELILVENWMDEIRGRR